MIKFYKIGDKIYKENEEGLYETSSIRELYDEYNKIKEEIEELRIPQIIVEVKDIEEVKREITRLNNIINELEKWLEEKQTITGINHQGFSWGVAGDCLDKLKELKEK